MSHTVSVYRYRNEAAISGPTQTIYIDAAGARRMARKLYAIARSIQREKFTNSTIETLNVNVRLGS